MLHIAVSYKIITLIKITIRKFIVIELRKYEDKY